MLALKNTLKKQWLMVGWPVLAAAAVNGLIFSLGWDNDAGNITNPFLPPGWVIGIIWLILFGLMGAARWQLQQAATAPAKNLNRLMLGFIWLCLTYPLYTLGLSNALIGEVANILLLLLGIYLFIRLRMVAPRAAWLFLPVNLWLAYAAFALLAGFFSQPKLG